MARSLVDGQRGEQLPHRGRELEAVARAGRADDDPAAALEDEPLVVGRGVEAALRPDRLRVGGGKPARITTLGLMDQNFGTEQSLRRAYCFRH